MYRKYMSETQFERFKQEQLRVRYMDTRRIGDVFPDIEKIEIAYHLQHGSAFGNQDKALW